MMTTSDTKLKIGIAGHRDLADESSVEKQIEESILQILNENNATTFQAFTSIAYGADTLFAKVAENKFNADIKIILPFSREEYERDFDPKGRKDEFNKWCEKYPPEIKNNTVPKDKEERNRLYFDCGKYLADTCDILIAVWDGFPASGTGGTGDIVDYANAVGKKVIIISADKKNGISIESIAALKEQKDSEAIHLKSRYNFFWKTGIISGLLTAYAHILPVCLNLEISTKFWFASIATLLALTTFFFASLANNKKYKSRRLSLRVEAERLRVIECFVKGNIPLLNLPSKDKSITPFDKRIFKIEDAYSNAKRPGDTDVKPKEELVKLINDQIGYHEGAKRIQRFRPKLKRAKSLIHGFTFLFVTGIILHLIAVFLEFRKIEFEHIHFLHAISLLLSLGISPLFAAVELWKNFEEWERFLRESIKMSLFFKTQLKKLGENESDVVAIAHNIREVMDMENNTWKEIMYFKKLHGVP
jgi:hypothetical protein